MKKVEAEKVAKHFLNEALSYYFKDDDMSYIVAINLAGVSEELIGEMLRIKGGESALLRAKKNLMAVSNILGLKRTDKELIVFLNRAKNNTKHNIKDHYLDPKVDAQDMIHRAIKNYGLYFGHTTEEMERFLKDRRRDIGKLVQRVDKHKGEDE